MKANLLGYSWKGATGYSYGHVLITNGSTLQTIRELDKTVVIFSQGGPKDFYYMKVVSDMGGLKNVVCATVNSTDSVRAPYYQSIDYRQILRNINDYYCIIAAENAQFVRETVKMIEHVGGRDFGMLFSGYTKDFGRGYLRQAFFESVNEVFGPVPLLGNWNEIENCRRASMEGAGYFDVLLSWIYSLGKKRSIKYFEVGPGTGTMTLSLKKLCDINATWLQIPNEESLWIECRRESTKRLYCDNKIEMVYGYLETDDLSYLNDSFDVVVLSQVMEHFIYNPVNSIIKLREMLHDDGYLFVSVPEEIKHYNVQNFKEMPYPEELTEKEREERMIINEFGHFHEYSYDEAKEVFETSGLRIVSHVFSYPIHHFWLEKEKKM